MLTRHGGHFDFDILGAGRTSVEQNLLSLLASVGLKSEIMGGQDFAAFLHRDLAVLARITALPERHHRRQTGIFQCARRHHGVREFYVFFELLMPDPNRVDRNLMALDLLDGFEVDAAGILGAVAEQHHRADGKIL